MRVVQLFYSGQYDELNALLYSLENRSDKDIQSEQRLQDAFDAFEVPEPAFETMIAEWMKRHPASYGPYLAKAVYEMKRACPNCSRMDLTGMAFPEFSSIYFEKARAAALAALKINEKILTPYEILMNINRYLKRTEENISLFQKALQYHPFSFSLRFSYLMGLASAAEPDLDLINDLALKSGSSHSSLKFLQGFSNWREGVFLMNNKQFDEAAEKFTEALSYGSYWKYYFDRAQSSFNLNDFDSALKDIQRAIKLRPQNETLYLLKAKICYRLGKFDLTSESIETAEEMWPFASSIHEVKAWLVEDLIYRAYLEYQKRQFEDALNTLELALYLNPAHPEVYSWRSMILKDQGKLREALIDLRKSIKLNPSNYASCAALEELLFKDEGQDEVAECWTNFLLLNPNRADAHFERGEIYWQAGKKKNAMKDMKEACDLGLKTACEKYKSYHR